MAVSAATGIMGTSPCPDHPDRPATSYCADHDAIYCELCTDGHGSCNDVYSITGTNTPFFHTTVDSGTTHSASGSNVTNETEALRNVSSELSHAIIGQETLLQNIKGNKSQTVKTIAHIRKVLNNHLNQLSEDYTKTFREKEDEGMKRIAKLGDLRDKVEKTINDLGTSSETDQQDIRATGKQLIRQSRTTIIAFKNMESIQAYEPDSIAVKLIDTLKDCCDRMLTYTAEPCREIYVRQSDDLKTCTIMATCLLEDSETLFVTDWENKKLKRIDATYTVCDSVTFPSNVCDVCQTDLNEMAVTISLKKMIQFVNIADKMELARNFLVGTSDADVCRAICCYDNKIMVNCGGFDQEASVKMFTKHGISLRVINVGLDGSSFFRYPTDVDLSYSLDQLFVTDEQKGILVFTKNVNYIKTLHFPDIRYPTGIYPCVDCWLLVCCYDTHKIYLVHKDGLEARVLMAEREGIKRPLSPCFDKKRSKVFVGMKGSDVVPVYNFRKSVKV